jgi:hypothetical protein
MRTLWLSLGAAALLAGCACGTKKADQAKPAVTPTPVTTPGQEHGHIPSILEPNHGMSSSRAAGFGKASEFLK